MSWVRLCIVKFSLLGLLSFPLVSHAQDQYCQGEVDLAGAAAQLPGVGILNFAIPNFNPADMILSILPGIPAIGGIPTFTLQQALGVANANILDEITLPTSFIPDLDIGIPCAATRPPENEIANEEEQQPVELPAINYQENTQLALLGLDVGQEAQTFIEQGGFEVPAELPRFGGVSVGELAADYAQLNLEMVLNHFAFSFTQFSEPVNYAYGSVGCAPRIGLPFVGCISTGICLPVGVAYNVPEDMIDVNYAGNGWFPSEFYDILRDAIKGIEDQADYLLLKLTVLANVSKQLRSVGGGDAANLITYSAVDLATLYQDNEENMEAIFEEIRDYQDLADTTDTLVLPGMDTTSTVRIPTIWPLGMPAFAAPGGPLAGIGMSSQFKDLWCLWCPMVRVQDHVGRTYGQTPRISKSEYELGNYMADRAPVVDMTFIAEKAEDDYPRLSEAIRNLMDSVAGAQAQLVAADSIGAYSEDDPVADPDSNVVRKLGFSESSIPFDPEQVMTNIKNRSANPFAPDGCPKLMPSNRTDGFQSTHETVNAICHMQKSITKAKYYEQVRNNEPVACAPDFRVGYCPRDDEDCECELNEYNIPTSEDCHYDVVYFNRLGTHYRGPDYLDYLEMHRPEELQKLAHEREQVLMTHYHRLNDCPDYEDVQDIMENAAQLVPALAPLAGIIQLLCGWERCDDEWKYEPTVARCEATGQYDIDSPLEEEIP